MILGLRRTFNYSSIRGERSALRAELRDAPVVQTVDIEVAFVLQGWILGSMGLNYISNMHIKDPMGLNYISNVHIKRDPLQWD